MTRRDNSLNNLENELHKKQTARMQSHMRIAGNERAILRLRLGLIPGFEQRLNQADGKAAQARIRAASSEDRLAANRDPMLAIPLLSACQMAKRQAKDYEASYWSIVNEVPGLTQLKRTIEQLRGEVETLSRQICALTERINQVKFAATVRQSGAGMKHRKVAASKKAQNTTKAAGGMSQPSAVCKKAGRTASADGVVDAPAVGRRRSRRVRKPRDFFDSHEESQRLQLATKSKRKPAPRTDAEGVKAISTKRKKTRQTTVTDPALASSVDQATAQQRALVARGICEAARRHGTVPKSIETDVAQLEAAAVQGGCSRSSSAANPMRLWRQVAAPQQRQQQQIPTDVREVAEELMRLAGLQPPRR